MNRMLLLACLFLSSFILSPLQAFSAEIININYKYKIAFSDLTDNDVHAGEMVAVKLSDGSKAFLKVLETYPVMVKLSAVEEGEYATSEKAFSMINVGSQVELAPGPIKKQSAMTVQPPVKITERKPLPAAPEAVSSRSVLEEDAPRSVKNEQAAALASAGGATEDTKARISALETRLEQMMNNNVKLTENITQLLDEKNSAQEKLKRKEIECNDAKDRAQALSVSVSQAQERIKSLEASLSILEQDKVAKEQEINDLNSKLTELKKKLAKMVEIINKNMKAYEQ